MGWPVMRAWNAACAISRQSISGLGVVGCCGCRCCAVSDSRPVAVVLIAAKTGGGGGTEYTGNCARGIILLLIIILLFYQ